MHIDQEVIRNKKSKIISASDSFWGQMLDVLLAGLHVCLCVTLCSVSVLVMDSVSLFYSISKLSIQPLI